MPRFEREGLIIKPSTLQGFHDSEEVFYCETTKEIFRDYDEYFRRIMLINSTLWACEATGREHLTYAEALKSEKKASEKGKGLRELLKGPTLLLAKIAQQASYKELSRLIYQFFKENYLVGEKVLVTNQSEQRHEYYEVIDIIKPKDAKQQTSLSSIEAVPSSSQSQYPTFKYRLRKIDKKSEKHAILTADQFKRFQSDYSYDRLNCFLRENSTVVDGIICPKENVYKKYVTDHNITFQNIFDCELPQWKARKKLSEKKIKQENKEKLKKERMEKNKKEKTDIGKDSNEKKKKSSEKEIKEKDNGGSKDKKQKTISQYLNKGKENGTLDNSENKNLLAEMEKKRKEKEAELIELERKKAELNARAEQKVIKVLTKCDDLERDDQKPLPMYKPVKSIVPHKYFGDLLMIQEYLHSFSPILSSYDVFPRNISFHQICRAFTVREVGGPLSDIFQVLISTVFSLLIEEDEESSITYREPTSATNEPHIVVNRATKTHFFVKKYYSCKIFELPIDALSLSEVLRLHLLSSGAGTTEKCTRWRYMYRNGYSNTEDPGYLLRIKQPHILRALKLYSVYQLPMDDIIKILNCLIDQISTYHSTISLLEERAEKVLKLQQEIRNMFIAENKRILTSTNKKKQITNEYNLKTLDISDPAEKQKMMDELNLKIAKMITQEEKDKVDHAYQVSEARSQIFDHVINLGMDRCYRQYFIFESLCGLFIEHPSNTYDDICLENPPQNCHELSNLPHIRQKLKPFFLERLKEMEKENSKKFKTENKTNKGNHNSQNSKVNGILSNNVVATSSTTLSPSSSTDNARPVVYGPEPYNPSQYELYMCTGVKKNCIVHNENDPNRCCWSYIHTEQDLEDIINSLNQYGKRESSLREQLILYKSLILKHIMNCPVNELSIDENNSEKFMNQIKSEKKYLNANFGFPIGTDVGEVMHNVLLNKILQFESDISKGHLGKLKVKDVDRWRSDLTNNAYDPQCKSLIYGLTDKVVELEDPGEGLGDTTEIKTEDSSDEDIPLHDSPEIHRTVQNLASALLQISQGIEQKFLKEPFGIKNELKDKEANEVRLESGRIKRKNWESSLMRSTNFSQVFLHLNILLDSVKWTKSSNYARCLQCRKRSVPEQMLLCDECNAGMHMFCMEPKLTSIPEGNWYCSKCVIKLGIKNTIKREKKKKKIFKLEDEDDVQNEMNGGASADDTEEQTSTTDSDRILPTRRSGRNRNRQRKVISDYECIETEEEVIVNGKKTLIDDNDEDNVICDVCEFNGADIECGTCNSWYHLECTDLRRQPRGGWECSKCKKNISKERSVKRKFEIDSATDSSNSTEDCDEPYMKRTKFTMETRSLRKRVDNREDTKRLNGMISRRTRHQADNSLPLNSVVLYDLLESVMKHADAWPFLRPVLASQVPDYYHVIKKPMDLGQVKSNLNMGRYHENQEVLNDIQLIFKNCDLYNSSGNDVYKAGKSLEHFVYKKCKELKLSFKPSDMILNELK